jgi:hypothetical protein
VKSLDLEFKLFFPVLGFQNNYWKCPDETWIVNIKIHHPKSDSKVFLGNDLSIQFSGLKIKFVGQTVIVWLRLCFVLR